MDKCSISRPFIVVFQGLSLLLFLSHFILIYFSPPSVLLKRRFSFIRLYLVRAHIIVSPFYYRYLMLKKFVIYVRFDVLTALIVKKSVKKF
jgi:hypothetical protein